MGTLLLIAWIIYLLGLHFLTNVGPFGNIISRLTAADQELIAYLAVAGVLLLYEIIIFFCVLGGSTGCRRQQLHQAGGPCAIYQGAEGLLTTITSSSS